MGLGRSSLIDVLALLLVARTKEILKKGEFIHVGSGSNEKRMVKLMIIMWATPSRVLHPFLLGLVIAQVRFILLEWSLRWLVSKM